MEHCARCGKEDQDLDFLGRCMDCFKDYVFNVKDSKFTPGIKKAGYTVTSAHYDDIVRRRIDSDGKVYRDYGRKTISGRLS